MAVVDKWLDMCWYAPATMWLEVGLTFVGAERSASPGGTMLNPVFADRVFATEDKPMLEAVQAAMGDVDFWAMKPAMLSVDAGAVRARLRLKELREAENVSSRNRSAAGVSSRHGHQSPAPDDHCPDRR